MKLCSTVTSLFREENEGAMKLKDLINSLSSNTVAQPWSR